MKIAIIAGVVLTGTVVFAQESDFRGKIQEDMDGYKEQIVRDCSTTDKLVMRFDGKLGAGREDGEGEPLAAGQEQCPVEGRMPGRRDDQQTLRAR